MNNESILDSATKGTNLSELGGALLVRHLLLA